jgi:copper chaperone CopZ
VPLAVIALRAGERSYVAPVADADVPLRITSDVPEGFCLRTFDVQGICCQGCGGKLHGALLAVEGVREAAVDPIGKRVEVLVRSEIEVARLEQALTFGKYSARALPATP